jgi:hypothetical protein
MAAMRRVPIAALLALALALAAGLLPAAAPGLAIPAALAPATALAADDIAIATAARYTVAPDAGRVRVTMDVTATNEKPDRTDGGTVTRYYFDGVNLGIQPEARSIVATQDGEPLETEVADRTGFRLVTVGFRENLYLGQSTQFRLSFVLPGGKPRSDSDIRVGPAFATFTAWAFGDRGSVRVRVPSGFRVDIAGETMEPAPGSDGYAVWTAAVAEPLRWYAQVTATNDEALTRDRLVLDGGDEVVIRGWPDDGRWRTRVQGLLRDGVPELVERIGLPWPVDGSLEVTEVHTPLLEGYAGFYDPATDRITISEDLDDLTILHEASHAWFNRSLFSERWITEGLADEYAARVLRALGSGYPAPEETDVRDDAAFPLADWAPPKAIRDEESGAREAYGYAASWALVRQIVDLVGEDGMREVFAAAAAGTTAYPGEGTPERSRLGNDWRRFIDLAQGSRDAAGIPDLVAAVVLDEASGRLLPVRATARDAYEDLVDAGGSWAAPAAVRMALDRWAFDDATAAVEEAEAVLATRDELEALAGAEGLEPRDELEAAYQDAGSPGELALVGDDADASLATLRSVAGASAAARLPRDWLTGLGLEGADPDARVEAARDAWEAGDLETARVEASAAAAALEAAPAAGRTRAAIVGGGAGLALVLLLGVAVVLVRRRRPAPHAAGAVAMPRGAGSGPDGDGPYATLRRDGPPVEPPGEPPSGDEGAFRS